MSVLIEIDPQILTEWMNIYTHIIFVFKDQYKFYEINDLYKIKNLHE